VLKGIFPPAALGLLLAIVLGAVAHARPIHGQPGPVANCPMGSGFTDLAGTPDGCSGPLAITGLNGTTDFNGITTADNGTGNGNAILRANTLTGSFLYPNFFTTAITDGKANILATHPQGWNVAGADFRIGFDTTFNYPNSVDGYGLDDPTKPSPGHTLPCTLGKTLSGIPDCDLDQGVSGDVEIKGWDFCYTSSGYKYYGLYYSYYSGNLIVDNNRFCMGTPNNSWMIQLSAARTILKNAIIFNNQFEGNVWPGPIVDGFIDDGNGGGTASFSGNMMTVVSGGSNIQVGGTTDFVFAGGVSSFDASTGTVTAPTIVTALGAGQYRLSSFVTAPIGPEPFYSYDGVPGSVLSVPIVMGQTLSGHSNIYVGSMVGNGPNPPLLDPIPEGALVSAFGGGAGPAGTGQVGTYTVSLSGSPVSIAISPGVGQAISFSPISFSSGVTGSGPAVLSSQVGYSGTTQYDLILAYNAFLNTPGRTVSVFWGGGLQAYGNYVQGDSVTGPSGGGAHAEFIENTESSTACNGGLCTFPRTRYESRAGTTKSTSISWMDRRPIINTVPVMGRVDGRLRRPSESRGPRDLPPSADQVFRQWLQV
jgi:hypothetical protein